MGFYTCICSNLYMPTRNDRLWCSDKCRDKIKKDKKRLEQYNDPENNWSFYIRLFAYDKLWILQNGKCSLCKEPLHERYLPDGWFNHRNDIDHVYPKSLAMADGWDKYKINRLVNLSLTHKECNWKKNTKITNNYFFKV